MKILLSFFNIINYPKTFLIRYKFFLLVFVLLIFLECKNKGVANHNAITFVEEMPQFPGGEIAMFKFINDSLKHPLSTFGEKIEGKVFVDFAVDIDGSIKDVRVKQSTNSDLECEAINVIKKMPTWKAGKHKRKLVKTQITLPIEFKKQ